MTSTLLNVFGLLVGSGLVVSGGIGFSRAVNIYLSVSQIIVGAIFVILAILLFAGIHF